MTVADTSKQSYKKLDEIKEMSQCDRILEALKKSGKPLTVNELNNTALADLDIPNGRVSARINKLKKDDKVVEADKRKDMFTERNSKTWTDKSSGDSSSSMKDDSHKLSSDGEPSNSSEFVSISDVNLEMEKTEGLFVDDEQSDGEVIWG